MNIEYLANIRKRPGMYFPYEENDIGLFHGLVCFIAGYECAMSLGCLVPKDFHQYVGKYYGNAHIGAKGWSTFIQENTGSELEAFNKFFELIEKYVQQRT